MRKRYTNVSIPAGLAEAVDKFIKQSKLDYRSRAELTCEAIRRLIGKEGK